MWLDTLSQHGEDASPSGPELLGLTHLRGAGLPATLSVLSGFHLLEVLDFTIVIMRIFKNLLFTKAYFVPGALLFRA